MEIMRNLNTVLYIGLQPDVYTSYELAELARRLADLFINKSQLITAGMPNGFSRVFVVINACLIVP
jgi:hypothetical protein